VSARWRQRAPTRGPIRVTVPNFVEIDQTVADISRFINFLQYGNQLSSWIHWTHTETTDEDYLSVFIIVKILNLVGIAASIHFMSNCVN